MSQWHSKGCKKSCVDRNSRCTKCRSACHNMNSDRHPDLFKPAAKQSLLPDKFKIAKMVSETLASIPESAISQDRTLAEMSGIMRLQNLSIINIGKSKVFVTCENCPGHIVCRKQSNIIPLCCACQKKKKNKKKAVARREMNRDGRVAPTSSVNWKYLDKKEVTLRAGHLRTRRRSKSNTINWLTEKIKTLRTEMDISDKFITHVNTALEYAIENKRLWK